LVEFLWVISEDVVLKDENKKWEHELNRKACYVVISYIKVSYIIITGNITVTG